MNDGHEKAVSALIEYVQKAAQGTEREMIALTALGSAGGERAVEFLISYIDGAAKGTEREKRAIAALGVAGRAF